MNLVMPKKRVTKKNAKQTLENISVIKDQDLDEYIPANSELLPYFYWWAFAKRTKFKEIIDTFLEEAVRTAKEMQFSEWLNHNREAFESIAIQREFNTLDVNAIVFAHDPYKKFTKEEENDFYDHVPNEIYLRVSLYWSKNEVLSAINEQLKPYYKRGYRKRTMTGNYFDIGKFRPETIKRILIALMIKESTPDEKAAIQEIINRFNIKIGPRGAANGVDEKKYQIDNAKRYLRRAESIMRNLSRGMFPVYK